MKLQEEQDYYIAKTLWRKARRDDHIRFSSPDVSDIV